MEMILILMVMVALAIASYQWGTDSRYDVNDPEWEHRQGWQGL